jgi:transposase
MTIKARAISENVRVFISLFAPKRAKLRLLRAVLGRKANNPHKAIRRFERLSADATLWIFWGIALETGAAIWFTRDLFETLIVVVANALIGIGLIVEYIVILRARIASGVIEREAALKVAEANARALEAQLALEKYRAPRHLTQEQWHRIVSQIAPFGPQQFDMAVNNADPEAQRVGNSIFHHLRTMAGWRCIHWSQPGEAVVRWQPPSADFPDWGINTMTIGVEIQVIPKERDIFGPVAKTLADGLTAEGVETKAQLGLGSHSHNASTIHILVGSKP